MYFIKKILLFFWSISMHCADVALPIINYAAGNGLQRVYKSRGASWNRSMRSEESTALDNPQSLTSRHNYKRRPKIFINLRLYYDDQLARMHRTEADLRRFLLAVVYAGSLPYSHNKPVARLAKWIFIVQTIEKVPEGVTINQEQFGEPYREKLGKYVKLLPYVEPHTAQVLFTGYNFRHQSLRTEAQGLALVGGGCSANVQQRAIIVEGRSYRASFVFAHELGHNLGLVHDEAQCGSHYLMSPTVGDGKTKFSSCSFERLKNMTDTFGSSSLSTSAKMDQAKINCFRYSIYPKPIAIFGSKDPAGESKVHNNKIDSYRSITADEQCAYALGPRFIATHEARRSVNICARLLCTNSLVQVYIHPAIENTSCGAAKYCRAGKCR